ncbi:putative late blight resistance protein homolog R1A-10 isoform X2 [Olea europaea var. sylvestris]|uniref:putative late blight resistance protein homolog R1A-10 isoform X2 n=1 Tax=Olea europaea var. sylvestris TaxID=158386 RepID=UPI000C1D720D|nr:putative late blight resistance protein homolog R1A-10 isoform X2 [Olea europaea var. sylvestris]
MAYAALLSLAQTLEQILGSRVEIRIFHDENQIKSFHENLCFLLSFLEDSSPRNTESMTCLEARIRDATYEAENIIELHMSKETLSESATYETEDITEFHMSKQILSESACQGVISCFWEIIAALEIMLPMFHNSEKYESLQKVIKEIDSILVDVKMADMNDIEGSSKSSSSNKSAVVGFDNDLMQITDPLCGPPPEFKSTSVVGIEDTEEVVNANDRNDVLDLQPRNSLHATSSKSASTNKNSMVGFEDDLLQIKNELVGLPSRLKFISIVGMGGNGKTTLARYIYNDSYIEYHFDIRAWITVSQEYHVHELLSHLLKSMGDLTDEMIRMDTDELKTRLYQRLKGYRYLIVMDDVWDAKVLDEFRRIFPDDNNGSRIILTSRLSSVAVNDDSSGHIHHLSFLSPKESWKLLCQKAFGKECCPPELEEIGMRIAEKCKGLPLELVVIGGVLYKAEKTRANWEYVAENVKSAVNGNDDNLMEILSWSYNHMPHRLRACFLYMGVFPEDYVIHVSHLIMLWVAEGFLKPNTHKSLEEVGKEYLEELIDRNLVIVRDRIYNGEIKTCSIHDTIRELCMRKAQEEKFLYVANQEYDISSEIMENQRCLSIHSNGQTAGINDSTIRSLLYFTESPLPNPLCFQLLRVLEAGNINFSEFPIEIVKLVNLRYIALSYSWKFVIPPSISKLCNLQTLIVFQGYKAKRLILPEELLKMPQLRHLLFHNGVLLCSDGPQNVNLQTLSGVIDFKLTQEALRTIPNLRKLGISYHCETQTELSFYCLENLVHLHQLESFKCNVTSCYCPYVPLPQNLAFPPNLKKLTLSGCRISRHNMFLVANLPNLEVLKLKEVDFKRNAWKTEGEFSRLKFLHVEASHFKIWEAEAAHFPSLQCLRIKGCTSLKCIPSGIGEILTLQQIILDRCPPSVVNSANSILKEQEDWGNYDLKVHVNSNSYGFTDFPGSYNREVKFRGILKELRQGLRLQEWCKLQVQKIHKDLSRDARKGMKPHWSD